LMKQLQMCLMSPARKWPQFLLTITHRLVGRERGKLIGICDMNCWSLCRCEHWRIWPHRGWRKRAISSESNLRKSFNESFDVVFARRHRKSIFPTTRSIRRLHQNFILETTAS
jgi:hypothetical protein